MQAVVLWFETEFHGGEDCRFSREKQVYRRVSRGIESLCWLNLEDLNLLPKNFALDKQLAQWYCWPEQLKCLEILIEMMKYRVGIES